VANNLIDYTPLCCFFSGEQEICEEIVTDDFIFEESIPANFEEEVVTNDEHYENFVSSTESIAMLSPPPSIADSNRSLLKNSINGEVKFKQTLTINRSLLKSNQQSLEALRMSSKSCSSAEPPVVLAVAAVPEKVKKFQQTVNFRPASTFVLNEHTMRIFKNKIKAIQKRRAQALAKETKKRPKKEKKIRPANVKKFHKHHSASAKNPEPVKAPVRTPCHVYVDPKNSGEIVRVEKNVIDEDVEVDILSNSEDDLMITEEPSAEDIDDSFEDISLIDDVDGVGDVLTFFSYAAENQDETASKLQQLKETDEETYQLLESEEIPDKEILLEPSTISNLEKFVHSEFFCNRPTKTPERFLRIRNHIINIWWQTKPSYLSKTAARNGLKKCGDVNVISRVHSMLEQRGVINFGCEEVCWFRPLKTLYEIFDQNIRNKNQGAKLNTSSSSSSPFEKKQRNNRNSLYTNGTLLEASNSSSIAFAHDGSSSVISTESSDSMINRIKSRTIQRTQFDLIKCQRFSKDNPAPFNVCISLSCLLCLHLHALSSRLEIMGFVGGHMEKSEDGGDDKLSLTRYKPCRTSNQSAINCEMCPVSQVEQSSKLIEEGYELLGWFHSHPNFPPIPSRTDLKTQTEMQTQFASNNPFIGFILSCVEMDFK